MPALLALLLVAACGNETGVLVEVTRDSPTTPADIDRLSFVIGLSSVDHPDTFLVDSSSISDVSVSGRDLKTSPYHLLVRQGDRSDAKLMIAVIAYKGSTVVGFAGFDEPQGFIGGQVLMRRLTLANDPSASGEPPGCVTWVDAPSDTPHQIAAVDDQDCDGDKADADCNDHDPTVGPSRTEVCGNGVDDNCNGMKDEVTDDDGDGVTNCGGDCDDHDANTHPGALETCDGKDNDCNGVCDDGMLDQDNDRFNTCGERIRMTGECVQVGVPDCNDQDKEVHPGANEICDGKDNDCDGSCDVKDGVIDKDGDGVTACGTLPGSPECLAGLPRPELVDCADDDPDVHPGAAEVCDGKDDDCNGVREQHESCYAEVLGQCRVGARNCDDDSSDTTFGLGPCMAADTSPIVSPGFCAAYAACEQMQPPPPDLFACANDVQAHGNNKLDCTLFFKPDLSLCPELRAPLPIGAVAVNCHWEILGGLVQAHYQVGLFDGNGAGGAQVAIDTCNGSFGVIDNIDFLPGQDSIYLEYRDDTVGPEAVEVHIDPMLTALCPQAGGLQCNLVPPM